MAVLIWGLALFAAPFGLHVLLWRIRPPRRQTRALLCLFLACLVAGLALLRAATAVFGRDGAWLLPAGPAQYAHIALVVGSLALAYVATYSSVEVDSPSLVMVLAIARAGPLGLEQDRLERELTDDLLVKPRIRDLLRDGLIAESAGGYSLTGKGRRLVRLLIAYRNLLGAAKGG